MPEPSARPSAHPGAQPGPDPRTAGLLPIVLVGGRSTRFGRDKLREPIGPSTWLVDRPIAALRAVFGPRVLLVGACDLAVSARGDGRLDDAQPAGPLGGAPGGPLGGVLAGLEHARQTAALGVFVLAGDLPAISHAAIRAILDRAARAGALAPDPSTPVLALLGETREPATGPARLEPCIGLYMTRAIPRLRERARTGRLSLHDAFGPEELTRVPIPAGEARNVNSPGDNEPR